MTVPPLGASTWSGCSVRIWLWPRLPCDCHRLLSILPTRGASVECPANWCSSLDPTSAGHFSCPGSTGLGHAGQGSLPPRAAIVAGVIWPHLVGRCGGLRLKNPVGTGPVKVSAHTTHNPRGGGGGPRICAIVAPCKSASAPCKGSAPRREADSQPISQLIRQAVSRTVSRVSRHAHRNTQFGFFFSGRLSFKQWGDLLLSEQAAVER